MHHVSIVNVNALHSFVRMSAPPGGEATLVQSLATLLRNSGNSSYAVHLLFFLDSLPIGHQAA